MQSERPESSLHALCIPSQWLLSSEPNLRAALLLWWSLLLWLLLHLKKTCAVQVPLSVRDTCAPRYISRRVPLSPYTTFGLHCRPGSAFTTRMLCSQVPACAAQASRPSANALLALKSPVLSSISCAQTACQHQSRMPSTDSYPHCPNAPLAARWFQSAKHASNRFADALFDCTAPYSSPEPPDDAKAYEQVATGWHNPSDHLAAQIC